MKSNWDDKKIKEMFEGLEDVALAVYVSRKIARRIFWEKFRLSFAVRLMVFIGLLTFLPFSYQSLAGDFVKFEILPMLGSILNNFEFSFDFISYQINFISSFLPVVPLLLFSFNLLVFCWIALLIFRDFRKFHFIGLKKFHLIATFILICSLSVLGLLAGPASAKIAENLALEKNAAEMTPPDSQKENELSQLVLTGIIDEVSAEMGQLVIEVRTVNDKMFANLRGENIVIYTDEETKVVKRGFREAGIADLAESDRVTVIGVLSENIFWTQKIVAATPWWKKAFK